MLCTSGLVNEVKSTTSEKYTIDAGEQTLEFMVGEVVIDGHSSTTRKLHEVLVHVQNILLIAETIPCLTRHGLCKNTDDWSVIGSYLIIHLVVVLTSL